MNSTAITDSRAAYAGFWRRLAAYTIDYVLAMFAIVIIGFIAELVGVPGEAILPLVVLLGYFLYFTLLESSSWQATIGKRVVGIKVTNRDGERIGFGRAAGRFFAKFLSALTLCIGYLLVVFTRRRQALHDFIAGTVVAHDQSPPRVPGWVVVLISCVAGLPITGILAAIAIPAYQDYTIRAQVTEGLALAAGYRSAVEAAWRAAPREFADLNSDSIAAELPASGTYVESIELVSGMIVITYGAAANDIIKGSVLTITPALDGARSLGWICGYGKPQPGFESVFDGYEGYTDIRENYVPSACRSTSSL
jgi:uncharacterized RDD family membrane protein YckC/Tfp pilus assembly major pilin PilA